jgi:hypothetical protein
MYNQRFFHSTYQSQANPLFELIQTGKTTTYAATQYSHSSINKLAKLTPLILADKLSTYQATQYSEDSVNKLTGSIGYTTQQQTTSQYQYNSQM